MGGLASLRKLKAILPQSQLLDVYRALVQSHLRYANVVWEALPNTKLSTLQKYQNRAFNLIESSKIKDAYNRNVLDVREVMVFDRAVMMFKIVNMLCPEGLQNKFTERSALSNNNTRNMQNLLEQKLKSEHTKKAFCTQLRTLGILFHRQLEMPRPLHDLKELKSHLLS